MDTNGNPVTVKPKSTVPSKIRAARQSPRSLRPVAKSEKLVCRYYCSDDLAPSFKKRRDALPRRTKRSTNSASSTTSPAIPSATASSPSTVRCSIMKRIACSYPLREFRRTF